MTTTRELLERAQKAAATADCHCEGVSLGDHDPECFWNNLATDITAHLERESGEPVEGWVTKANDRKLLRQALGALERIGGVWKANEPPVYHEDREKMARAVAHGDRIASKIRKAAQGGEG